MWRYGEITREVSNSRDLCSTLCEVIAHFMQGNVDRDSRSGDHYAMIGCHGEVSMQQSELLPVQNELQARRIFSRMHAVETVGAVLPTLQHVYLWKSYTLTRKTDLWKCADSMTSRQQTHNFVGIIKAPGEGCHCHEYFVLRAHCGGLERANGVAHMSSDIRT